MATMAITDKGEDILKSISTAFLISTSDGNVHEAYNLYIGEQFIHHNIYFKGDANSLKTAMAANAVLFPEKQLEIKQVIREENMVVIFSHVKMKPEDPGLALIHIFRFENNKIVEMWDIGQQIPLNPVNENGMF
jgi:predicted SnoaL-like aldol condensation-catalyzing enzyme